MNQLNRLFKTLGFGLILLLNVSVASAQELPTRYATLELFTNTPCPICGSQNPGLFNRLNNYGGQYHLISFYPGKPYSSCIYYQANVGENTTHYQYYAGEIFGSPTVALNGIDFKSSSGVTNAVLDNLTGGTSWLHVGVEETTGTSRTVTINLEDVAGGSLATGRLFAVIVEKEIQYNAPNGETIHHNVFRRFLSAATGEEVDLSGGSATRTYQYDVDGSWNAAETYIIAWLADPASKEIYNSGTRFDPDFTSSVSPVLSALPIPLFPNPASTEVNLSIPGGVNTALIQIYNQQGGLVRSVNTIEGPHVKVSTEDMSSGHYFIRLATGGQMYSGSFEVVR